ncbi:transglutaminase family protein [Histidinibacterium aquaticum]|uniref:Transglutaminase family protein n=1 Tax=Histidinibacterium aquaticum TaxID=2613962 RepID=A0A5J5GGU1_9RHOB|nr:transglutaminase family protein [Histidinibacterium aquaticum]KAA9006744.1 transglutaminase family protein [Histidinibacterium aquaticum]
MLYDIRLSISYDYDQPAAAGRHLLRILPRGLPDQQVISGRIETDPPASFRRDGTDFFGNPTTEIAIDRPVDEMTVSFTGRVQREVTDSVFDLAPRLEDLPGEIAGFAALGPEAPHHFLGRSDRVHPSAEITTFARDATRGARSVLGALTALTHALHAEMAFDAEATEVSTPTLEAFNARRGVCQDFSHVMIAALRGLGIPAGYVSGFLRTLPPEGRARLEGADAMHAWVRAWCGTEMGWVQVDPTNDMVAGNDHVVVAFGRDYADVAPIRGALRSSGSHSTRHEVDVVPVNMERPSLDSVSTY